MERLGRFAGGRVRIGVSPHAPYTVSGTLYAATAAWAREAGLPIAVHLAESPAESALLASGTGAFADAWRRRGIPMPAPLGRLARGLARRARCAVGADALHPRGPGRSGGRRSGSPARTRRWRTARCPTARTATATHRSAALLAAGLRVGLGTDSVVSVGPLDLLAEARAARALAGLDAARRPRALHPGRRARPRARARGRGPGAGPMGRLCRHPARAAPDALEDAMSAEERVLASGPRDVLATFVGGRDVHRTSPPL